MTNGSRVLVASCCLSHVTTCAQHYLYQSGACNLPTCCNPYKIIIRQSHQKGLTINPEACWSASLLLMISSANVESKPILLINEFFDWEVKSVKA